ncbi:hypothetical protein SEUCBS140593_006817 [Sporothrix eucalyptigena]|uniref:Heterokaryon incompatibility domain-containing protein n=1 Tax=Sporothrix eucalyptigena TaxID=1812306 RepID=A0ABP0C8D0_9PEZI
MTPYEPLEESRSEVRLLTLLPGMFNNPLRGYLENHSLATTADVSPFEALSYFWGEPNPAASILINGCELLIARNLELALRHLRSLGQKRVLWIDAVCINQSDILERNWQILAMDAVYSRASRVVVWLGPADPGTDAFMDSLGAVDAAGTLDPTRPTPTPLNLTTSPDIDCILVRLWWRRSWIVQEFVLAAEDPLLVCGHKELAWAKMRAVTVATVQKRRGQEDFDMRMDKTVFPMLLDSLRDSLHSQKSSNLTYVLPITEIILQMMDFQAVNPRDKIYACLGLLPPDQRKALAPDYNKSVQQVYTDTARQILATPDLAFFSAFSFFAAQKGTDDNGKIDGSWPSWVPDISRMTIWTARNPHCFMDALGWRQLGPRKQAPVIRDESVVEQPSILLSVSPPVPQTRLVVGLPGFVFDTVDAVVMLEKDADLLRQVIGPLHEMAVAVAARPLDPSHPFAALERDTDVAAMIVGGERKEERLKKSNSNAVVRDEARKYGISLPERYRRPKKGDGILEQDDEDEEIDRDRRWEFAQKRCFFTTTLGFSGICTEPTQIGDVVTIMYGERLPVVLRPQSNFQMQSSSSPLYTVIGAAHVGAILRDRQVVKLCQSGKLEEVVFDLM